MGIQMCHIDPCLERFLNLGAALEQSFVRIGMAIYVRHFVP